jgi:peptidoglycan hydrolase CwlO-like protein
MSNKTGKQMKNLPHSYIDAMEGLQRELAQKDAEIERLDKSIYWKGKIIKKLQEEIERFKKEIALLNDALLNDGWIYSKDNQERRKDEK